MRVRKRRVRPDRVSGNRYELCAHALQLWLEVAVLRELRRTHGMPIGHVEHHYQRVSTVVLEPCFAILTTTQAEVGCAGAGAQGPAWKALRRLRAGIRGRGHAMEHAYGGPGVPYQSD